MGPLGKDLVSIAVIVAVLRQSSEAGEGVKTERTNPSRSHHSALTRGYLLLQIDRVSLLAILRVVGAPFDQQVARRARQLLQTLRRGKARPAMSA
jgi:hypothetical protein